MKRRILAVIAALTLTIGFVGCNKQKEEPQPEAPAEFPAHIGTAVVIERPLRVATISPAMTDMVVGLGLGHYLVGAGTGSVVPVFDLKEEPQNCLETGTLLEPDLSAIKRSKADILFTHAAFSEETLRQIQQMNVTVIEVPFAQTIEEAYESYTMVCQAILGEYAGPVYAKEKIERYKQLLSRVKTAFSENGTGEKVIFMRSPLLTLATGESLENTVLSEVLGYTNLAEEYSNYSYPQDKAVELEPEIIFYHKTIDPQSIIEADMYKTTAAVVNEKLYAVNGDYFERRSPQMFMELIRLTYTIFPDALPTEQNEL